MRRMVLPMLLAAMLVALAATGIPGTVPGTAAGSGAAPAAVVAIPQDVTPSAEAETDPGPVSTSTVRIPWPLGLLALSAVLSVGLLVGKLRAKKG